MSESANVVTVKCGNCGKLVDVQLTTEEAERNERIMGAEVQYDTTGDTTCECGQEIEYSQSEWEYPEGVVNNIGPDVVNGGSLVK
ncbi:hypothetical protein [Paraburkholderia sp. J94]|uniref:hypothetical protein n=1 Tax=Paraburkholderia sp. J94 TaxID=2805441 RepID=UPI002AB16359|nr:hypothetical protein [Paraburkholderia sp. J94]